MGDRRARQAARAALAVVLGLVRLMAARQAVALEVVGYSAAVNDRFTAGYPSAPLTNAGSAFVGRSFSWLGVEQSLRN